MKKQSPISSQITLSQLKDLTPTNFSLPTRYPCIICYERCIDPLSCMQCTQIICAKHVEKIKNKCPNCRLSPFKYNKDEFLTKATKYQLQKQRDILISKATFTCLVQSCNFQGKYHQMDLHKRRCHRNEELKNILFPEEMQRKKRREMIEKLFIKMLVLKQQEAQVRKKAQQLYNSSNKKAPLGLVEKMTWHLSSCSHEKCKEVIINESMCFIGDNEKNISECEKARRFMIFFDE